jgi:hypothetical protein
VGFLIVLGLIFAGAGLWLTRRGMRQHRAGLESWDWPVVEGQVVEASVHTLRARQAPKYLPSITYTYTVAGQPYTGNQRTIGDDWWTSRWLSSQAEAQAQIEAYQPEGPVKVYYNPQDPAEAVLEPGSTSGASATLVVGFLLGFIGLVSFAGVAVLMGQ